jgi:hypothetical protein
VFDAIGDSKDLLRRTWGQQIVSGPGYGVIGLLVSRRVGAAQRDPACLRDKEKGLSLFRFPRKRDRPLFGS